MNATSAKKKPVPVPVRKVLHVGCGHKSADGTRVPLIFKTPAWQEVRLDIDPETQPDIVASMTRMPEVADESMDAIYSSHNLEHLYAHEIELAIREFHRVLAPDGFVFITCPDMQSIAQLVAEDKLFEPAYNSPAGPIAPYDMIFGYRKFTSKNPFMAHRSGFTLNALLAVFNECGFKMPMGVRNPKDFDLWALIYKNPVDKETAKSQFERLLKF